MAQQPTSGGPGDGAGHRLHQEAAELRTEVERLRQALAAAQGKVSHAVPVAAAARSQLQTTGLAPGSSQTALLQNEERLRAIIESAVDHAIITTDFEDRITGWNSGARERGGPAVAMPPPCGFGSRLIEAGVTYQLGGDVRLAFEAEGVECRFRIPLSSKLEGA